jgi:hypothetical protein
VLKNTLVRKFEFTKDKSLFFKKIETVSLENSFDFKKYIHRLIFKDFHCFKNFFFGHLIYCCDVLVVLDKYNLLSMLVTRICKYKKSTLNTFVFNLQKLWEMKVANILIYFQWHLMKKLFPKLALLN